MKDWATALRPMRETASMAKGREKGEGREEEERVVGVEVAGVWRKSGDPKQRVTRCNTIVNPYFSPLISRLAMEAVSRCDR